MSKKRLFLIACPIYLLFYMGDALLSSYYGIYFVSRELNANQRSLLLAIIPFALFGGCLLFSYLAKTPKRALWLFRLCAFLETALVLSYPICETFAPLLVITSLLGFFNGAPFALIEGYLVPLVRQKGGNYSTIRIFGSLGYIVSLGLGFFLLRDLPVKDCYFFSTAFFALSLVLSFFLRYEEAEAEEQKDEGHKTVFGKSGWIYIASQFLLFGAYNASLYVLPLQLHDLSFGDENYSLARSIAVAAELGLLLLMPLLSKLLRNKKTMLYIGMGLIAVSTIFPCFVTNPWALAYGNLIVGHVGKAFLFAFEALFLIEVVGKESLGRMLTIKVGGYNFSTAVLNLLSGAVSQGWGYRGYFLLLLGMEVLGIALFVFVHPQKINTIMSQKA